MKRAGVAMQTLKEMQLVDAIGNHCKKQSVALMGMLRNEMLLLQHRGWGEGVAEDAARLPSPDLT